MGWVAPVAMGLSALGGIFSSRAKNKAAKKAHESQRPAWNAQQAKRLAGNAVSRALFKGYGQWANLDPQTQELLMKAVPFPEYAGSGESLLGSAMSGAGKILGQQYANRLDPATIEAQLDIIFGRKGQDVSKEDMEWARNYPV